MMSTGAFWWRNCIQHLIAKMWEKIEGSSVIWCMPGVRVALKLLCNTLQKVLKDIF
jgi:hypothetical protein